MGKTSEKRRSEIRRVAEDVGVDRAAKHFGITREGIRRYMRSDSRYVEDVRESCFPVSSDLKKIEERYSKAELAALASGGMTVTVSGTQNIEATQETFRIGVVSDTHFGSKHTDTALWDCALETFDDVGVEAIFHCGDVTEGMSSREGHVYELTHVGHEAQLGHACEEFGKWSSTPIYLIDGNHDRWYTKRVGANIVKEISDECDNVTFLGHDEGDVTVGPVKIRLWHGEDGSSYAFSYRIQKIVESFSGGEKPHVLLAGHTHKAIYVFDRNVHCLSAGSIQRQSKWMRSKRHAAHVGHWTAEIGIGKTGVTYFSPTWYPAYS